MARKSKQEAQVTREALLDTAESLFREKGVAGTSLDAIAIAAGVTRGAVYWHFKNKADLFGALCERATTPMRAMLNTLESEPGKDPLGTLKKEATLILTNVAQDAQLQSVFEVLLLRGDAGEELSEVIAREEKNGSECRARLESIFSAAIECGQLPKTTNARTAAVALSAYVCGLMRQWLQTREFDLEKLAPNMVDIFFTGLLHAQVTPENR